MVDELVNCVSQHPVLFDKGRKNYEDNVWRGIVETSVTQQG